MHDRRIKSQEYIQFKQPVSDFLTYRNLYLFYRKQLAMDSQKHDFVSQRHAKVAREAADRQKQLRNLAAVIIAAHEVS